MKWFPLFKKKQPPVIAEDPNEQRAAKLVRRYAFDFSAIPKAEIIQLLQEELCHPISGSAEYMRVLCGYLYCLGDETDVPLLEKAKYSVHMDIGCMIDIEWIESLKNGGEPGENLRPRAEIIRDFVDYYKDF